MSTTQQEPVAFDLAELGFERCSWGYMRGPWQLCRERGWWRVSRPWPEGRDPLADAGPGLWKCLGGRQVFEWPEEMHGSESENVTPGCMLQWAWGTADGTALVGWNGLRPQDLELWCAGELLTVGSGSALRQIEVVSSPSELVFQTPILQALEDDLPLERRAWLRRLSVEVQERWPLLRLRETRGGRVAEVNLTGVPHGAARVLISVGLASLRGAVGSLAGIAELLADVSVASEALAYSMVNRSEKNAERNETNEH